MYWRRQSRPFHADAHADHNQHAVCRKTTSTQRYHRRSIQDNSWNDPCSSSWAGFPCQIYGYYMIKHVPRLVFCSIRRARPMYNYTCLPIRLLSLSYRTAVSNRLPLGIISIHTHNERMPDAIIVVVLNGIGIMASTFLDISCVSRSRCICACSSSWYFGQIGR